MQARMSMITLGVADLAKARRFYEDGLGLPILEFGNEDKVAFFNLNGTWLGLFPWDELAKDAGIEPEKFIPQADSSFRGVTIAHNLVSKEAVDMQMQEALAAGAKLIKQPQDVFWGGYSGYFADIDGHLWEVAHNPFTWVGPNDEGA
ncbi:MAG: VOC family protein [Rhizobiales bacterium]|nr:VOC family protein [Hyphomicrobiales bacterium]